MRKTVLGVLLLAAGFSVMAKSHKHKKKQASGSDIIAVSMRRTACFGRCPDYTIQINKNGMATYTGRRFTPDTGTFTKNITAAKAMAVLNQFSTYKVDTCQDQYENKIQDVPGIIFTIKYANKTKNINNANFGPSFLRQLASVVDDAGKKKDDSWKKVPPSASK